MLGAKEFRGVGSSLAGALLALAGVGLAILGLAFPQPLLINLGVGDDPFARGFRSGWERDGTAGSGETTFHWTLDGSRLEFPFEVGGGRPVLRLRLARFSDSPASVRLQLEGREVDAWTQGSRGWSVREIDLDGYRGPLRFQFRSESIDELGVALDWAEIRGAGRLLPQRERVLGLGLLLVVAPLLALLVLGRGGALATLALLLLVLGACVCRDPLGAVWAFSQGAPTAIAALVLLAALVALLRRAWRDVELGPAAAAPALLGTTAAALLLSHPFFYYPDITSHARFLAALRADPYLAWDASDYQKSTDSWAMREIAGRRLAFPYSPAFHVLALPIALVVGDVPAIKAAASLAVGASLLLVHLLARAAALSVASAALAQLLLASFPVTASRLTLALFPALLGQATDLMLVVHLARRFSLLSGARDAAWLFFFLCAAQGAYTASLFNVALLVALFGGVELVAGDRPKARRLLGAYAASLVLVVALQYASFLPVLLRDVLPYAAAVAGTSRPETGPLGRFVLFYGWLAPALALLGVLSLSQAPRHVGRLLLSILGSGAALLMLRYLLPGVFRDAKEIELLAPTLAVLSAAGLASLGARGRLGRVSAVILGGALLAWGAFAAHGVYAGRFVAIGLGP